MFFFCYLYFYLFFFFFFFQAEDGIRDLTVTGVQTCALPIWLRLQLAADLVEDDAPLLGILVRVERRHRARLLELRGLVHEQRRVAAVVDDQRRAVAVGPHEGLDRAPPVLLERLALPREHRDALRVRRGPTGLVAADDHRGRGVVLRR